VTSAPSSLRLRLAGTTLALVVVGLFLGGCALRREQPEGYDAGLGVRTFEAAWRIIYETHFDVDFNGVDWLALKDELTRRRPRRLPARSCAP